MNDTNQYQEQIKVWTGYTHYLLAVDGLLLTTMGICKKKVKASDFKKVSGVITSVHIALQGVDKEFIDGIKDMEAGKKPTHTFDPSPIPDWPTEPSSASIFLGAWESIQGVLENLMSKTKSDSAMAVALAGLINSGTACVEELEKAFSKKQEKQVEALTD